MKYRHRVAVMLSTQIIMDVEADNDLDSIKKRAIDDYFNGKGNQEEGMSFPTHVVIYPMLEEGQPAPKGTDYPNPTYLPITSDDLKCDCDKTCSETCECEEHTEGRVINLFNPK